MIDSAELAASLHVTMLGGHSRASPHDVCIIFIPVASNELWSTVAAFTVIFRPFPLHILSPNSDSRPRLPRITLRSKLLRRGNGQRDDRRILPFGTNPIKLEGEKSDNRQRWWHERI